jgi:hypothetical protein
MRMRLGLRLSVRRFLLIGSQSADLPPPGGHHGIMSH